MFWYIQPYVIPRIFLHLSSEILIHLSYLGYSSICHVWCIHHNKQYLILLFKAICYSDSCETILLQAQLMQSKKKHFSRCFSCLEAGFTHQNTSWSCIKNLKIKKSEFYWDLTADKTYSLAAALERGNNPLFILISEVKSIL
jgi:hypothetical protein